MCREIIEECQSGHASRKYENGCLIMDGAENRRGGGREEVHMREIIRKMPLFKFLMFFQALC